MASVTTKVLGVRVPTIREESTLVGLMVAYWQAVEYGRARIKGLEKDRNIGLGIHRGN